MPRNWTIDPQLCCRVYRPECVPRFNFKALPGHVKIRLLDRSFWLIDVRNGIRYRRITMADLPDKASWANGMSRKRGGDDEDDLDDAEREAAPDFCP